LGFDSYIKTVSITSDLDAKLAPHDSLPTAQPGNPEAPVAATTADETPNKQTAFGGGWRFYEIVAALSVIALLPAIEGTIVSTALPTIVGDLHGGELYVWVVNSYFLSR
jgi:hypothetical protein